jgi:hypothetical protein
MLIKTSELTDKALGFAVATIEYPEPDYEENDRLVYVWGDVDFHFSPSTDWQQGGPIIDRERIQLRIDEHGNDFAVQWIEGIGYGPRVDGPTPLIAAMRCYVASKLGDEVEIPDELMFVLQPTIPETPDWALPRSNQRG